MPKITVALDDDSFALLKQAAAAEDRTPAQMARVLIKKALTDPVEPPPTQPAISTDANSVMDNMVATARDAVEQARHGSGPHRDRATGVMLRFIGREMKRTASGKRGL